MQFYCVLFSIGLVGRSVFNSVLEVYILSDSTINCVLSWPGLSHYMAFQTSFCWNLVLLPVRGETIFNLYYYGHVGHA